MYVSEMKIKMRSKHLKSEEGAAIGGMTAGHPEQKILIVVCGRSLWANKFFSKWAVTGHSEEKLSSLFYHLRIIKVSCGRSPWEKTVTFIFLKRIIIVMCCKVRGCRSPWEKLSTLLSNYVLYIIDLGCPGGMGKFYIYIHCWDVINVFTEACVPNICPRECIKKYFP